MNSQFPDSSTGLVQACNCPIMHGKSWGDRLEFPVCASAGPEAADALLHPDTRPAIIIARILHLLFLRMRRDLCCAGFGGSRPSFGIRVVQIEVQACLELYLTEAKASASSYS